MTNTLELRDWIQRILALIIDHRSIIICIYKSRLRKPAYNYSFTFDDMEWRSQHNDSRCQYLLSPAWIDSESWTRSRPNRTGSRQKPSGRNLGSRGENQRTQNTRSLQARCLSPGLPREIDWVGDLAPHPKGRERMARSLCKVAVSSHTRNLLGLRLSVRPAAFVSECYYSVLYDHIVLFFVCRSLS